MPAKNHRYWICFFEEKVRDAFMRTSFFKRIVKLYKKQLNGNFTSSRERLAPWIRQRAEQQKIVENGKRGSRTEEEETELELIIKILKAKAKESELTVIQAAELVANEQSLRRSNMYKMAMGFARMKTLT
ncbi:hypothetical protein CYMTET_23945 [Cymbomonas tetramitiformis]|uniref:Uncharacterized protein n=1 Tax=Cymbomonas tetramitiformis TaxID=36881 RepID=A0AAE0FX32_9CHLO|nr:hypothetical protein CYMTET_23945 [Cymbomonas tetramitiformis]